MKTSENVSLPLPRALHRAVGFHPPFSCRIGLFCLGLLALTWTGPQARAQEQKGEWISLFDGKTLEGWKAIGSAIWRVEDKAVLVGTQDGNPSRSGLLTTTREFQDFVLELEFMIDEHGKYNSGVYLRNTPGSGRRTGYQINIGRAEAEEYCGVFLHDWLDKGDEKDEFRKVLENVSTEDLLDGHRLNRETIDRCDDIDAR